MKPTFSIGAGKGKLLGVLHSYFSEHGIDANNVPERKLVYEVETDQFQLRVALLRWEDIKQNYNQFDLVTYGTDQWLEGPHKSMNALQYFPQENCRISLLAPSERENEQPGQLLREGIVATSYPNLAEQYLGIPRDRIKVMTGSVEASIGLGWADYIFDLVETGKTAEEHDLREIRPYINVGSVLATARPEKIPMLTHYGAIKTPKDAVSIAFDGNDGTGKSTLANHLVQNGLWSEKPAVLVTPYSGRIGRDADSLRKNNMFEEWASTIGKNHWRAPSRITSVYDRSMATCLTELVDHNATEEAMQSTMNDWQPLPNILFLCVNDPGISFERLQKRGIDSEFNAIESLQKYHELYIKAAQYIAENTETKVVLLDTNRSVEDTLDDVKNQLDLEGLLTNGIKNS